MLVVWRNKIVIKSSSMAGVCGWRKHFHSSSDRDDAPRSVSCRTRRKHGAQNIPCFVENPRTIDCAEVCFGFLSSRRAELTCFQLPSERLAEKLQRQTINRVFFVKREISARRSIRKIFHVCLKRLMCLPSEGEPFCE